MKTKLACRITGSWIIDMDNSSRLSVNESNMYDSYGTNMSDTNRHAYSGIESID